ncbi:hypothetical protein [Phaeobacter sp. B1627]|uniref:hypothetical protein n=1 Tax=Phaeobacter sp. B1627 TaxID=2583809 RepID=UPI00111B4CCD|nr:hypothetical protein [Phaeobacter sp. B1627]TNJ39751.1 hypothetical protein FGE21_18625 [Phaeobacter sp. B1627]
MSTTANLLSLSLAIALGIAQTSPVLAQGDSSEPWTRASTREVPYPPYGLEIGSGWNSFLGQRVPATCVDVMEVGIPKSEFSVDYEFVQDTYAFAKSSSSAGSGSFKGFGFKASVSASGTSQTRVNRDFLSALFRAEFNFGSTQAVPMQRFLALLPTGGDPKRDAVRLGRAIRLTEEARALVDAGDVGRFLQTCGDAFVLAVHRGVRVNVLATYSGSSQSDKQTFAASVSAKGFGGAASFASSGEETNSASTKNAAFQVYQEGGIEPLVVPGEINATYDLATALDVSRMLEGQSSFSATVMPYANLIDFAGKTDLVAALTLFDRLDDQRALFYFLGDLEAILAEIDRADIIAQPDAERIYSPLHVKAMLPVRSVASTRFQVFRLLRILGSSIDACYTTRGTCDPQVIEISEAEQSSIQARLTAAAQWLTDERAAITAEIADRQAALSGFVAFGEEGVAERILEDLWSGTSAEDILNTYQNDFVLRLSASNVVDRLSAQPNSDLAKSLVAPSVPGQPSLPPQVEIDLPRVWNPGANGIDMSAFSEFALVPEMENEIRTVLNSQVDALRDALESSREKLRELRESAEISLRDFETYFAPLVDMSAPHSSDCSADTSRRFGDYGFAPKAAVLETSDDARLLAAIKILSSAQPCATIAIGEWAGALYQLAAATPLTKDQLNLAELTSSSQWGTAAENSDPDVIERRRDSLIEHIRWKTYAERLYPLRESLCQTSIAEAYCIDNQSLRWLSGQVDLAIDDAWLLAPEAVTPPPRTEPPRSGLISSGCPRQIEPGGRYVPWACQ